MLTPVIDWDTLFVLNRDEKLKLKRASSIVLSGGLTAENILFNVLGDQDSSIESGSIAQGTILAQYAGKLKVKEPDSRLFGVMIGSGEVVAERGGTVVSPQASSVTVEHGVEATILRRCRNLFRGAVS